MTILLLILGMFPITSSANVENISAETLTKQLIPIYKQLHQHPELSYKEEKTAALLASELKASGFEVTERFGGYGVVAVLKNGKGPTVMLRTDLDALPVAENTGLPYASVEPGIMHACGHDLHVTNLIGVARYLKANLPQWKGTLILIGQPAEEKGGGASAMLKSGLFKKFPKPDYALALHVDGSQSVGKITLISGPTTANVDSLDIIMKGRGGHGARPHDTIDPIPMTAELVLSLQTLISREKDPSVPAVITVGSFHSGTKHNIIPETASLQITVRTFSAEERRTILDGIKRKAKAIALAYQGPEPEIRASEEGVPSVINDSTVVEKLRPVFNKIVGSSNVIGGNPWTVGEDFSRYGAEGVPSVMFSIGTLSEKRLKQYRKKGMIPSIHSASYYPSAQESLEVGIKALGEAAIELFSSK